MRAKCQLDAHQFLLQESTARMSSFRETVTQEQQTAAEVTDCLQSWLGHPSTTGVASPLWFRHAAASSWCWASRGVARLWFLVRHRIDRPRVQTFVLLLLIVGVLGRLLNKACRATRTKSDTGATAVRPHHPAAGSSAPSARAMQRFVHIDGLRGALAVVVVANHTVCMFYPALVSYAWGERHHAWEQSLVTHTPIGVLFAGEFAVVCASLCVWGGHGCSFLPCPLLIVASCFFFRCFLVHAQVCFFVLQGFVSCLTFFRRAKRDARCSTVTQACTSARPHQVDCLSCLV